MQKKIIKFPIFQELYLSIVLPISKGNFVGNVYLSVLRFPAPKPVCCYAERMDKPET